MARTTATNFSGPLQFPYATAAADPFKKEDVQQLALAVDQHTHGVGAGHGLVVPLSLPGMIRATDSLPVLTSGVGIEMEYVTAASIGLIAVLDRTGTVSNASYKPLQITGKTVTLQSTDGASQIWQVGLGSDGTLSVGSPVVYLNSGSVSPASILTFISSGGNGTIMQQGGQMVVRAGVFVVQNTAATSTLLTVDGVGNTTVYGGLAIQDNLGFRIAPATSTQFINFGTNVDFASAQASTLVFRRNYDNVPVFTIHGSGGGTLRATPRFVSGDRYLVMDEDGNIHVSSLGPDA